MSKFAAALSARHTEPALTLEPAPLSSSMKLVEPEPAAEATAAIRTTRKVGRPAGKRSNDANTQVTGYVPAQLYYDVRIKLLERKMKDRNAKIDFSDLLREWMESWLANQP